MSNPCPLPAPPECLFKPGWRSGKTKTIKLPIILEADIKAIAKCLDINPAIADKVLQYAQSLVEQSEQNSPDCL